MTTLHPWINFNGNAEVAFTFYKSVFGGEFSKIIRMKDIPQLAHNGSEKDQNKLLMIALPVGGTLLIGNDVPEAMGRVNERENRSKISIQTESKEEANRLFSGLSEGGEIEFPIGDSPWGTYYGSFRDKYGIEWMVECSA